LHSGKKLLLFSLQDLFVLPVTLLRGQRAASSRLLSNMRPLSLTGKCRPSVANHAMHQQEALAVADEHDAIAALADRQPRTRPLPGDPAGMHECINFACISDVRKVLSEKLGGNVCIE